MIFKLNFPDKHEYAQAKNALHLLQEYYKEYGDDFIKIESVDVIDEEAAKTIILKCVDEPEEGSFSLYDTVVGDDFVIVGSTEWDGY